MNVHDIGAEVTIRSGQFTNASGSAIDPTTVTLVIEAPDGTETTYTYAGGTVTRDSLGNYSKDFIVTMAGTYDYRWTSTGTGTASKENSFQVRPRRVS